MARLLVYILFISIFSSCSDSKNQGRLFKIDDKGWDISQRKSFVYSSEDTLSAGKFSIFISLTDQFKYDDLPLELKLISPNGNAIIDTILLEGLSHFNGDNIRKISKIREFKFDVAQSVKFSVIGKYVVKIGQIKDQELKGVTSLGFYVLISD